MAKSNERMWNRHRAFTLVELLVVIAIIGTLVGLLFPAIQQVREAARRTQCKNRLRQIGLATTMFHDSHQAFPPARLFPKMFGVAPYDKGSNQPTWLVRILPFIEQKAFFDQWDLNANYEEQLAEAVSRPVELFLCPSRRGINNAVAPTQNQDVLVTAPCGCGGWMNVQVVGGATGDYAGNHGDLSPGSIGSHTDYYWGGNGTGVIISSQAKEDSEGKLHWIDRVDFGSIPDGTSNTVLAGELHVAPENLNTVPFNGPIYNGEDLAAFTRVGGPGAPLMARNQERTSPVLGFGSWHPGICNFVFSDGSTRSVDNWVDTVTLGRMCHRYDGDPVEYE